MPAGEKGLMGQEGGSMGTALVLLVQFWGEYVGLSPLCTPFCCPPLQLPTLPLKAPLNLRLSALPNKACLSLILRTLGE